jgi:hypothetical protein
MDHSPDALIAAVAHVYATDPGYAHLAEPIAVRTNVAQALTNVDPQRFELIQVRLSREGDDVAASSCRLLESG